MKKVLLIAACFSGFVSNAQTFQWDTNDSIEENLALNTTVQFPLYQSAVGTDTVTLAIEVIYNDLPASWDGMLCIYGVCLGTIPPVGTQAQMDPIYGSLQGMVRLTVNPLNGTETAKLQVYVYDVDYPNDGDTATFLLNTTAAIDALSSPSLTLAPNPATDFLSIHSDASVQSVGIRDLQGKLWLTANTFSGSETQLNLAGLPSGIYWVELATDQGIAHSRLVKQ